MRSTEAKNKADGFKVEWYDGSMALKTREYTSFDAAMSWAKRESLKFDRELTVTPTLKGDMFGGSWWISNWFKHIQSKWQTI